MLTINKLEKIIELEENLRAEYQGKLDTANEDVQRYKKHQTENAEHRKKLEATISQQLETIQELSSKASANQKLEQRSKELHNRSENLQEEIVTLKQRMKALQKDLAREREQIKELTKFDPVRMRTNLDAGKKKLAEKTQDNDRLQKSLKETRNDKVELQRELEEVKAQLAVLEPEADPEAEAELEAEVEESSEKVASVA